MESIEVLAERIVEHFNKDLAEFDKALFKNWVASQVRWHLEDCFKLVKNINETSVNRHDRSARLIEAELKYGIPKTHLL